VRIYIYIYIYGLEVKVNPKGASRLVISDLKIFPITHHAAKHLRPARRGAVRDKESTSAWPTAYDTGTGVTAV
jgi:hypothetical protein